MAFQVPIPRSYQSIFGEISDTFRARYGISRLKIGGPFLRIFEAAAQSDLRCTQDVFNLLDLADFNRLSGSALEYKAAEEGLLRLGATAAQGVLTFTDPRFKRLGSRIYSGSTPPVAGTTALLIADATLFAATGQIYVGRGTINAEGPLTYTSKSSIGQYWLLTLATPTTKFHNVNEDVVMAQGGNRTLPIGTAASTAKDGRTAPIVYATTQQATILDGEVQVTGVPMICRTPGRGGNTPTNTIVSVTSSPFPEAACTNPMPLVNARDAETDDELKERLRKARSSKARGTSTAILFGVQGLSSTEDQRSVLSASLVQPAGEPATLYIDDGTGYEEQNRGVAFEVLMDFAGGGEQHFSLSGRRPISKAFLTSGLTAPFSLQDGCQLAILGGGTLHIHIFDADEFTSIGSATAQEVVSSINSDPNIEFSARTAENGTRIAIFSRNDINEDLEVVAPGGLDANLFLGFSTTPAYTLRLYRNDLVLYKDGLAAIIVGAPQSAWTTMTDGVEFRIGIDQTPLQTYIINDADFVNAGTIYTTVSQTNSVAAWAAVLNSKIPGITASDGGGFLVIASNLGANNRAGLIIESTSNPNLVQAGVFTSALGLSIQGLTSDYTLDRMTGEIKLARPLAAGDNLTVGSNNTRAFLTSLDHTSAAVTLAANARLYVAADSQAQAVTTNVSGSTAFTISYPTADRTTYTASSTTAFGTSSSLLQVGDYVIIWDPAFEAQGVFRICDLPTVANFDHFTIERPAGTQTGPVTPTNGGIKFFRLTTGGIQTIRVAAGTNRALTDIAAEMTAQLANATVSVYHNTMLRIRSNDFRDTTSEIAVLTADQQGQLLGFPLGSVVDATLPHRGSVVTAAEVGTPVFGTEDYVEAASTDLGPLAIGYTNIAAAALPDIWGLIAYNLRRQQSAGTQRFGALVDQHFPVAAYSTTSQRMTLRHIEPAVVLTSLARSGTTVTVTMPGPHRFAVGDMVWVGPQGAADGAYPVGIKFVATVPSGSTWTYTEAGATGTAATPYVANIWFGVLDSATAAGGDLLVPVRPLAIGAYDTLNFTLNGDTLNQTYVVPMQRRVKPASANYLAGTPIQIVDLDNADNPLSDTFGTQNTNFFQDFWVYQRARTVSHKVLLSGQYHEAILWRATRFGPEGNRYWLRYGNPVAASAPMTHSVDIDVDANVATEPGVYFTIQLPSDVLRTGLNFFNTTMWTWAVSVVGVYKQVVITYSAPVINTGGLIRASGTVTATTTTPHGFASGQIVYLTSADANYPSGPKLITVTGGSTFTYSESGTGVASTSPSSVSSAPGAPNFGSVAVGDIVTIKAGGINQVAPKGAWRVYATTGTSFTIRVPVANAVAAQTTPVTMGNQTNIQFYPILAASSTASDVVTYALANMEDLVLPTLLGLGDGQITMSTADETFQTVPVINTGYGSSVAAWQLSSGLSWVDSSDLVSSPNTITLKAIANANPDIQTAADITNEEWRLAPVLASGLARWLSSPAVTGAYATTDFDVTGPRYDVQASSRILGSSGGVQVTGGLANGVSMGILGGAEVFLGTYGRILVDAGLVDGIHGDVYVALSNGLPTPKAINFAGASLQVAANGDVTVSGGPTFWTKATLGTNADKIGVHRVGNFTIFCLPNGIVQNTGPLITDPRAYWFQCTSPNASQVNQNAKRVVGYQDTANHRFIWVENPQAVDEVFTLTGTSDISMWTPDSVMPGDTLEIGFDFGGFLNNQGTFTVTAQGGSSTVIKCGNKVFTPAGPTALGVKASLVRVTEPNFRLIERVRTLIANPLTPTSIYILLAPSGSMTQLTKLNPNLGSNLVVLDKLGFDTEPADGADGYSVTTGLIGEVVRVLYGDPNAPTLYPGIVAVGSTIYVAGPNAKRIRLSLQIRVRSGQPIQTIVDRVRAAVATEINRIPLATAVDLSRIVAAARKVQGVISVVVLSPTYTSTQDVIPVQSNEKPFVFDAQSDILLTPLSI